VKTNLLEASVLNAPWDDQSAADFARAAASMDAPAAEKAQALASAQAQAHAVLAVNGVRVGTLVYEVEAGELFVTALAASSRGAGVDLLATFQPQIEALARRLGCTSIRFGTSRPGMVERTKALGYRVAGVVMRKSL
jgi:hypothetical protein